jgi:hypothetical protein
VVVTIRSRSSRNGSKTHFTGQEALLIQSKPKRSVRGAWLNSPAPKEHNEVRPGFFPTVAWPSEAVRGRDDSITFIQKRVEDPFYGPRVAP